MDSNQRFLALVIPISWYFTVHIEAHDRLGHQTVNRTYHLVKCQHYWRGMNEDIHKSTNNCALCKRENTGISPSNNWYSWQTFRKNSHRPGFRSQCLCIRKSTYTDCHWSPKQDGQRAFSIPDKKADTIVQVFINNYLPIHIWPHFILSDKGTELTCQLMHNVLQQLGIDHIFSAKHHQQSNGKFFWQ